MTTDSSNDLKLILGYKLKGLSIIRLPSSKKYNFILEHTVYNFMFYQKHVFSKTRDFQKHVFSKTRIMKNTYFQKTRILKNTYFKKHVL